MFVKNTEILIAGDNYVDVIGYPIQFVTRKSSIASYNFAQKIMFFSHINRTITEVKTAEFNMVKLIARNTKGRAFEVVCDDKTLIGISRGRYIEYVEVRSLKENSSILIDDEGLLCKIQVIEPYYENVDKVYNTGSNKGSNKFVNGLMFKA